MSRLRHPQVSLEHPDGGTLPVDRGIAPLVRELWRVGAPTTGSCQELNPGEAWVAFATVEDAERMATLVGPSAQVVEVAYETEDVRKRARALAAADPHNTYAEGAVLFPSRLISRVARRIRRETGSVT